MTPRHSRRKVTKLAAAAAGAIRVEGDNVGGLQRDPEREAALAAAHLEHTAAAEVTEAAKRGEMCAFRVERPRHQRILTQRPRAAAAGWRRSP